MTHPTDDDLVLLHYGEDDGHAAHLAACAECAARYRRLSSDLQLFALEAPERGDHYGLEIWQRIRHRLPEREPWWRALGIRRLVPLAAAVVLVAAGFLAGRLWPAAPASGTAIDRRAADADASRVLLLTVADHLERSDRILTDLVNASAGADISGEQQRALDLVAANRLYRQDALAADEASVAAVLDELERTLLEIVHHPAEATDADLAAIRRRIDSAALLFKVRLMSTELRQQDLSGTPEPPLDSSQSMG